ncbi:hypothetical protein OZ71_gp015 [Staphylococcus phage MCE-2014]|uniref:Homing endonuclease n=1 Tax=Staphylococcus phage MCE-2014 TaxID=1524910 RepID=A0A076G4J0_9CAUD|nr:hypothetical protein OZ71_gp015 [Staphylococcus phage MCE-2014]AII26855.1 hypothetical protein [Staphylococcus phage MCE-2014]
MEKNIIKVRKSNDDVWVDLSKLPFKKNKSVKYNYDLIEQMENIEVPFSYKGLNDSLYITLKSRVPEATYDYVFKGEKGTITISSLNRVALDRVTYNERKRQGLIKRFNGKRSVDISHLPKIDNYKFYGRVSYNTDFKNSIGLSFNYEFNDTKGTLKIIDYFVKRNNKDKIIEYVRLEDTRGNTFLYNVLNIIIGNLQRVAEPYIYPYKEGDTIGKFNVKENITEEKIAKDGKVEITRFSIVKCNECGMIKKIKTSQINNHSKEYCSDCSSMKKSLKELNKHRSRGESMVEQVLKQQGIEYVAEKSFDWSNRKRYDFYLPEDGCVIEVHGVQHYLEQNEGQRFSLTLEENKKNDKWKKDQAIAHGLKYIEIDVRDHNFDYIKQSIIDSVIPTEDVDWKAVYKYMENGFIIEVIELYNSGLTPNEIGKKLKVSSSVIIERLKQASKIGLIEYTPFDYKIKQLEEKLTKIKKERQEYLDKIRDQD